MTVHAAELATELAAITQPVNTARGLPNRFYVDRDVFEEEKPPSPGAPHGGM